MATDDMSPDEGFGEDFDNVDEQDAGLEGGLDPRDLANERITARDTVVPAHRLSVLLFTLGQKLQQRRWLGLKAFLMLTALMVVTLFAALATPVLVVLVRRTEPFQPHWVGYLVDALYVVIALTPFVITTLNYFWTTYAQIFFRGLRNVEAVMDSDQFSEFSEYVHVELLTDDWSVLSLLQNVFAVDVGFSMLRFFIVTALLVIPLLVQAGVSLVVVLLIKGGGEMIDVILAGGLTIIYFVFFVFTLIKDTSFHSSLTR